MIYFPDQNLLYIHIPRTGGTSLINAFLKVSDSPIALVPPHTPWKFLDPDIKKRVQSTFTVAFFRNSWARIFSWFVLLNEVNQKEVTRNEFNDWVKEKCHAGGVSKDVSEFSLSQMAYISQIKHIDFIGRYESFHEDVQILGSHLGLDLQTERMNGTEARDFRQFYDSESIQLIQEVCREEIEIFNFLFHK